MNACLLSPKKGIWGRRLNDKYEEEGELGR